MSETFITAYKVAALWSSTDDEGNPLDDDFSINDFSSEANQKVEADCAAFLAKCEEKGIEFSFEELEQAGHDFWLTRNHHGCGFWDGDWSEHGEVLTEIAHSFGEAWIYVGDDEKIYFL